MKTVTYVKCKFQIEGFHRWDNAFEEVSFLASKHRHIFHVEAYFAVEDDDREIEFITIENEMKTYLREKYGQECDFGGMSCEMIAKELLHAFNANSVEVREDEGGGAKVWAVLT